MPIDISSVFNSRDSIEYLVQQYMRIESRPRDALVNRKTALDDRRDILSSMDSKLSALKTKADRLTDDITDYFAAKLGTSSDKDRFTVSAGYSAALGNHSLSVERLAVSDTRVSKQYNDGSSSFTGFSTDQTFKIQVGHPIDSDSNNRVDISITVTADKFSQTDELVLSDIADAINNAMTSAVTNETIETDEVVRATVVTEQSGTSRLILRSENSGYTYRMDFTDSADSLLTALEVNGGQSTGTSGGYITTVGTDVTSSMLNAKFTMDGLTFYRDSNNVTDALTGVTIQLLDVFSTTETITINADESTVRSEVQDFIDSFNEVIKFLQENTRVDPNTYERGQLANDITYSGILNQLRNYVSSTVTVSNSSYAQLYNIGIEADDDGLLSIKDSEKFTDAIETNSTYVSDLFKATDGVAENIKNYIDAFVKTGGTIDSSKDNVDDQIISLDDRIAIADSLLVQKEIQLRNEFSKIQQAMAMLSSQQSFFGMFTR